jgi:hypothetical protein
VARAARVDAQSRPHAARHGKRRCYAATLSIRCNSDRGTVPSPPIEPPRRPRCRCAVPSPNPSFARRGWLKSHPPLKTIRHSQHEDRTEGTTNSRLQAIPRYHISPQQVVGSSTGRGLGPVRTFPNAAVCPNKGSPRTTSAKTASY